MQGDLQKSRRLYQTLLLPNFSSIDDVRQSYKSLVLKYHPDKNLDDPSAAEKFRDVRVAYEILSNVEAKRKYDSNLRLFQPLGVNSYVPGARTPRNPAAAAAATGSEAGFNPYMPTGNATSSIYEELNTYAAKRAGRQQQRRASSARVQEDRASQYTKEQKEFFKKREKVHQAELRKRLEQERREQRERELEALRREQEVQRWHQHRPAKGTRRTFSASGVQRASPIPTAAVDPQRQAESRKSPAKPMSAREPYTGVNMPDTVRPVPSPRVRRPSVDQDADRAERLRREKERQTEVRRAEQEKYVERLMKQRIRELRLRKRETEEAEQQERENQQQLFFLSENSEREQMILPQEQLERRRLWREYKQCIRHCLLRLRSQRQVTMEKTYRNLIEAEAEAQLQVLYLGTMEAWQRGVCHMKEILAWKTLTSWNLNQWCGICIEEQTAVAHRHLVLFDDLCTSEALEFTLIEMQQKEDAARMQVVEQHRHLIAKYRGAFQPMLERYSLMGVMKEQRAFIAHTEDTERAIVLLAMQESVDRCAVQGEEEEEVLRLIKQRAVERQAVHIADEERARVVERRANASAIATLQVEIQRLKRALRAESLPVPREKRGCSAESTSPYRARPLLNNDAASVVRNSVDVVGSGRYESVNAGNSNVQLDGTPRQRPRPATPSRTPSPPRPLRETSVVAVTTTTAMPTASVSTTTHQQVVEVSASRRATAPDAKYAAGLPQVGCGGGRDGLAKGASTAVAPLYFSSYLKQTCGFESPQERQSSQRSSVLGESQ
ncbi:chaperone DnaJ protein [Trypanosoma grayi]|uniref:chaperone DnaJ protein n=1 Tax=Trypanosoma grayi TaxID=71804 RepID=UPI0004F43630|nr:chaperone DnaJ protein [Trypanosoma grayi]KEG10769.1 chaperone DnaJ protein [Trypanosoma grayi]